MAPKIRARATCNIILATTQQCTPVRYNCKHCGRCCPLYDHVTSAIHCYACACWQCAIATLNFRQHLLRNWCRACQELPVAMIAVKTQWLLVRHNKLIWQQAGSSTASCLFHLLTVLDRTMLSVYRQSGNISEQLRSLVRICRQLLACTVEVLLVNRFELHFSHVCKRILCVNICSQTSWLVLHLINNSLASSSSSSHAVGVK